jgi:hypothetical protein
MVGEAEGRSWWWVGLVLALLCDGLALVYIPWGWFSGDFEMEVIGWLLLLTGSNLWLGLRIDLLIERIRRHGVRG